MGADVDEEAPGRLERRSRRLLIAGRPGQVRPGQMDLRGQGVEDPDSPLCQAVTKFVGANS